MSNVHKDVILAPRSSLVLTDEQPEAARRRRRDFPPASDRERTDLDIEVVTTASDFEALRDEWTRVLTSSSSDCVFLTWEWLFTWWKHLAGDRTLSLLLVRQRSDGELVAIAPFCISIRRCAGAVPACVEFLGTGTVSSDHIDLIIKGGREERAIDAVAEYLVQNGLTAKLVHYNRSSSLVSQLASRLQRRGWKASETTLVRSPFIRLNGHTWDSYLATLDSDYRHRLRRRLRKLYKDFDVRIEEPHTEEERGPAVATFLALHDLRWRDRGGSRALHTPALRAFHDEVSRLALERGWLRLFIQSLDGKPAAARYGFRYGRTFYSYQGGFDPAYARHWIGILSLALVIKSSIEEGAEEHDLLAGDEGYKSRLTSYARDLGRLELFPPGVRWIVYRKALELYRAAFSRFRE